MMLHALGRHSEADKAAGSLGFKHRLNDAIFSGGKDIEAREDGGIHAAVFDAALGEELLAGLREVFGTGSSFWTKHEYPTDGVFLRSHPPLQRSRSHLAKTRCRRKRPFSTKKTLLTHHT